MLDGAVSTDNVDWADYLLHYLFILLIGMGVQSRNTWRYFKVICKVPHKNKLHGSF